MLAIFLISGFVLGYTLCLYPVMIGALARWRGRPWMTIGPGAALPPVSMVIPVFNEERILGEKIANCLALDYPADRIEFIFALDGCTDASESVVAAVGDPRIRCRSFPVNRGKVAVLNDAIPAARGALVVISDASGMVNPGGLRELVAPFADPEVGGAAGVYRVSRADRSQLDSAEHSYHGFEMKLRGWEGLFRTTLSGTGSLFAFRKAEFEPFPAGLINEDYVQPARLALRGRRVLYIPGAQLVDRLSTRPAAVFRRRVRIAYGNWQQIRYLRGLLNPARGYLFWVFVSHKLLRMLLPFVLVLFLASSAVLGPWVAWSVGLGAAGLVLAGAAGLWLDRHFRNFNPLSVVALVFINIVAVFVGTGKYIAGRKAAW
ncbi:MAG TPA: glycosyltransferase family 2 protein [Kiritimatiellia bacterium]|nr:glycosyltransferase family 2 protein [Kiritimatiellia bacterium]HRZ12067.1 glycosyltransferase family 2 protein [Kiritimatiellia bacterium]HSA19602.1 glycosyltransferase family 2 protein [Kiritimatiellia bacterium]